MDSNFPTLCLWTSILSLGQELIDLEYHIIPPSPIPNIYNSISFLFCSFSSHMTKTIANGKLIGFNGRHGFLKTRCLVFNYCSCIRCIK